MKLAGYEYLVLYDPDGQILIRADRIEYIVPWKVSGALPGFDKVMSRIRLIDGLTVEVKESPREIIKWECDEDE